MLALRNAPDPSAVVDRSAKLDLSSALAREAIESREANAAIDRSAKLDLTSALARRAIAKPEASYVSPEQADRTAMLAVRNAMASADAIERQRSPRP